MSQYDAPLHSQWDMLPLPPTRTIQPRGEANNIDVELGAVDENCTQSLPTLRASPPPACPRSHRQDRGHASHDGIPECAVASVGNESACKRQDGAVREAVDDSGVGGHVDAAIELRPAISQRGDDEDIIAANKGAYRWENSCQSLLTFPCDTKTTFFASRARSLSSVSSRVSRSMAAPSLACPRKRRT